MSKRKTVFRQKFILNLKITQILAIPNLTQ